MFRVVMSASPVFLLKFFNDRRIALERFNSKHFQRRTEAFLAEWNCPVAIFRLPADGFWFRSV